MDQQDKIKRNELSNLLFHSLGAISVKDLGVWLETKTGGKYTTIEKEFITEALIVLQQINFEIKRTTGGFKESWLKKSDTLKRVSYDTET